MEWLGRAKIEFTHAPTPRAIREKSGNETDLLKIVEAATPPCHLNPLLFNGHLQTIWTATKPHGPPVYYLRKIFDADHKPYQGTFAVDFAVPPFEDHDETLPRRTRYFSDQEFASIGSDDSKPMLVVLHGLSGGSHEVYLRHTIAPLLGDGGWEVCVVNSRGCARSKVTSGFLYNARATWDIRQYCGEEGENCLLKGAVACSNPFNLEVSSKILQNRLIGREVYLRIMGMHPVAALRGLVETQKDALLKYSNLDLPSIAKVKYLHEFDREVQCPTWGYPTETAYYRDASSTDAVLNIRIPFVALHATDDPIAVREALPYEEFRLNPNTVMVTTSLGGHLCWFELGGARWHPKPVCNFLNHLAFQVDLDSVKPSAGATMPENASQGPNYQPMRRRLEIFRQ
ncbi:hypothetical protein UVI_02044210 [Ustilaginoidea virens]|uniref:Hydrolase, alpha/beta fold family n=1 Tax=Ustilaginoidea virens TaxID=1159556 RepID=A0A1B5L7W0_USTVR|nr:hypothetical protein UVI_02044210 [Ustilaginoidea virens]